LLEAINKVEQDREREINVVNEKFNRQIQILINQCGHIDGEGNSTLILAGSPFHSGWDQCIICGRFVETNEYGRK